MKNAPFASCKRGVYCVMINFHAKNSKAYQGSIQVNPTNESGICALALPHRWVLLDTWTVGKSMGKPFDGRTRGQLFATCVSYAVHTLNGESPASALL